MKSNSAVSWNSNQKLARLIPRCEQNLNFMQNISSICKAVLPLLCGVTAMVTSNQGFAASAFTSICDLGGVPPGGCDSITIAHGFNLNNAIVVGSSGPALDPRAFFSSTDPCPTLTPLGVFQTPNLNSFCAFAIAATSSRVVGVGRTSDGLFHALTGQLSTLFDIETLGGDNSVGYGINGNGRSVGTSQVLPGPNQPFHAFRSSSNTDMDATLPWSDMGSPFGGDNSVAYAVSGTGNIVGAAETLPGNIVSLSLSDVGGLRAYLPFGGNGSGKFHAFLRANDANTLLPIQTTDDMGTLGGDNSVAYGINGARMVGTSQTTSGAFHAFHHFAFGTLDPIADDINGGPFISSAAYAVNGSSEAVGMGEVAPGEFHAFLHLPVAKYGLNPGMHDLNDPDVNPAIVGSGWVLIQATGIINDGRIAGTGYHFGQLRAFLLTPWVNATPCEAELATANANISSLTCQLSSFVTQNSECQSQLTAITAQNGLLQNQLAGANTENAALQAQVNVLSTQNATLTTQNGALQNQLDGLTVQVSSLSAEKAQLQSDLVAANAAIAGLNSQKALLQTQLNSISQQYLNLAQSFQTIFNDPQFQISGATPAQQTASVIAAIGNLNHGQKKVLYKNLGP